MKKVVFSLFLCLLTIASLSVNAQNALSESFFAVGVSNYYKGEYKIAISYFQQCDSLDAIDSTISEERRDYAKMWMASCFYKLGQIDTAKALSPKYYKYPPVDRRKTIKSDSLAAIATAFFEQEQYDKSLKALARCAAIEKDSLGEYSLWYENSIAECSYLSYNMYNYNDAIKYGEIANKITSKVCGFYSKEHIETLTYLIDFYGDGEDYENVKRVLAELENINDSIVCEDVNERVTAYMDIASYHEVLQEYSDAARLIKKAFFIAPPSAEDTLSVRCFQLFDEMIRAEDYGEASEVGEMTLNLWTKHIAPSDSTYDVLGIISNRLGECYSAIGNYLRAIELYKSSLNIYAHTKENNDSNVYVTLNLLASSYNDIGRYDDAIICEQKAIDLIKRTDSEHSSKYAIELSNLAFYLCQKGRNVDAYTLCEEAYNIVRTYRYDFSEADYTLILSNLSTYYANLGNYSKAVQISKLVLDFRDQTVGKDNFEYATSLNNLATYLSFTDDYNIEEVIKLQNESKNILEGLYGRDNRYYIESLSNLAVLYDIKGLPQYSLELLDSASLLAEKSSTIDNHSRIIILYSKANIYSKLKDYGKAIENLNQAYSIMLSSNLQNNPDFIKVKVGLYYSFLEKGDLLMAKKWMNDIYDETYEQIVEDFPRLTTKERESYWSLYSDWYYEDLPQIITMDKTPQTAGLLYNSALLSKGILLGTNIEIDKLIGEESSSLLDELYKLRQDKTLQHNGNSPIDTDSIMFENEYTERKLVGSSNVYKRLKQYYSIKYLDVRNALNDKDIAIEFITDSVDNGNYYALCLKKKYESPHIVRLFGTDQIRNLIHGNDIDYDSLSTLVWQPLSTELIGVQRIFFAPAGILYKMPIEYASTADQKGTLFADKYSVYRLSSTRQLVLGNIDTKDDISSITLYGGLNYTDDSINGHTNLSFIQGSKNEIEKIKELLPQTVKYHIFEGNDGTPASFMALSGSSTNVLHCATHAYYWSDSKNRNNERALPSSNYFNSFEDKALSRSGIYLSKDSNATDYNGLSEGKLNACEISKIDLRGTQLVVLSSCKSGLGDINGEGVFGLQRGFKKSGAQTIIMSLWKVDDTATEILMTEFYRNYLKWKDKRKALNSAQKYIRGLTDAEGNYLFQSPYYWAGFIILD